MIMLCNYYFSQTNFFRVYGKNLKIENHKQSSNQIYDGFQLI